MCVWMLGRSRTRCSPLASNEYGIGDVSGGAGGFYEETVGDGMVRCVRDLREKWERRSGQPSVDAAARHAFILSTASCRTLAHSPHGGSDSAEKNWNGRSAQAVQLADSSTGPAHPC